jgi:hypothetical protein
MSTNNAIGGQFDTGAGTALALNANWTTTPATLTNTGNVNALCNSGSGYYWNNYWYPYYQPLYVGPWIEYRDRRPIRLTMDEVERLRVAAKKDKGLKETLEKFTDHIEVIVDFGKAA